MAMHHVFITGCAGFIGFHLARRLLQDGYSVTGIDNLNDYYDVKLKEDRLNILSEYERFHFFQCSLENKDDIFSVFPHDVEIVVHLAAQAGVRYSLVNPYAYIDSNIVGFMNILELCRQRQVGHLIFASSSSVYGANTKMPFSVHHNVDHPISLYAATKKANELMAHTYSHLYNLPVTGLRFFTVYGPWGRPDMALFKFTRAILAGEPIKVFNYGKMKRDFTYVDDVVEGIVRLLFKKPEPNLNWNGENPDPGTSRAPYKIYNIGNNNPVDLLTFISIIEQKLGRKAILDFQPMQPGDVPETYADVDDLMKDVGYKPATPLEVGIEKFVEWYKDYYKVD